MRRRCSSMLKRLSSQQGMTLVEMLVAMAISLVVVADIYQIFVSSATGYSYNVQLARLQENGRFAVDFLAKDVRVAAYRGCENDVDLINGLNNANSIPYDYAVGITGYDNVASPVPAELTAAGITPNAGTDVLILRGQITNDITLFNSKTGAANLDLVLNTIEPGACADGSTRYDGICQWDILMISDCRKARIFQATSLTSTTGNTILNVVHAGSGTPGNKASATSWGGNGAPASEQFGTEAEVVKYATKSYFIQNNAAGKPGLYRKLDAGVAQEMVPGVESLQVLYGEDTNNDDNVDSYVTANAVSDWARVLSVRIGLLVRSPDEIGRKETDVSTYQVNGQAVDPMDDRRLRRVYVSTVGIRNRLP